MAFLDACKIVSNQSVPTEFSDGYGGATGTLSLAWTPCVDVLFRSVSCIFPSHLLHDGLAQPGSAGMCGMGHLKQS